jgi:membrane protease YdiL (CAAX protease family)
MLKTIYQKLFSFNANLGITLILLFGIPRFVIVLEANAIGNYNKIPIIFLLMWCLPFILLSKEGRIKIGIVKPKNYLWLVYSFLLGAMLSVGVYYVGYFLYEHGNSHWFVYTSKSFEQVIGIIAKRPDDKIIYFWIYAIISMTFSPIGEELLYRGVVHSSFVSKYGEQKASYIDSAAFAFTHLAHFGIVYIASAWNFLFIPALIWVFLMFVTSQTFFICKQQTGSIFGAIISHAGFNLTMMYFIFYHIIS